MSTHFTASFATFLPILTPSLLIAFPTQCRSSAPQIMDFIVTHGKLKERDARRIFRQVVEAIDYCHEVHVIRTSAPHLIHLLFALIYLAEIAFPSPLTLYLGRHRTTAPLVPKSGLHIALVMLLLCRCVSVSCPGAHALPAGVDGCLPRFVCFYSAIGV